MPADAPATAQEASGGPARWAGQRAELYLCLARSFMTPREPGFLEALRRDLPADLLELLDPRESAAQRPQRLPEAGQALADDHELLKAYSRLFLTPPFRAPLNAGLELDGALMGPTTQRIQDLYRRYDLASAETFKDLPDHLGSCLEFSAYLWALLAEEAESHGPAALAQDARPGTPLRDLHVFLGAVPGRHLPALIEKIGNEAAHTPGAALYQELAELTQEVITADRGHLERLISEAAAS